MGEARDQNHGMGLWSSHRHLFHLLLSESDARRRPRFCCGPSRSHTLFYFCWKGRFPKVVDCRTCFTHPRSGAVYSLRNSSLVQTLPGGRLLQISFSDATAQSRFWVWGEAWQGFLERPIFGWGPENFTAVYDEYFNPVSLFPAKTGRPGSIARTAFSSIIFQRPGSSDS